MDFTFLREDQIWGDDALEVMKLYGTKVAPTDLTVILGGCITGRDRRTSEGDITCESWSASIYVDGARGVCFDGDKTLLNIPYLRDISARPALPPSEASKISPSEARAIGGIRVAEYGEYPQTVADKRTSKKLERLHGSRSLRPTGKNYTFDSVDLNYFYTSFNATSYPEYEMDGKRYIRVPGRPAYGYSKLSTGKLVEKGKPYWVEVQPIEWLMDRSGTMVAKKCLFAGIQFDTKNSYDGDFSKTFMKHYLDTYFAKEMEPTGRVTARTVSRDCEEESKKKSLWDRLKEAMGQKEVKEDQQGEPQEKEAPIPQDENMDAYEKGFLAENQEKRHEMAEQVREQLNRIKGSLRQSNDHTTVGDVGETQTPVVDWKKMLKKSLRQR